MIEVPGFQAMVRNVGRGKDPEVVRDFSLTLGTISETVAVEGVRPKNQAPNPPSPPQRIRVGGNVQAANLISRTSPEYPKELQEQGVEGTVEIEAIISKTGNMLSVHPRSKNIHQGLVEAAARAVRTWQYKPTLLNGEPVEVVTTVTVRFSLK